MLLLFSLTNLTTAILDVLLTANGRRVHEHPLPERLHEHSFGRRVLECTFQRRVYEYSLRGGVL